MKRRTLGTLLEVLETVVLTLLIFLLIQTFVAQPYQVEQQSMEHTLEPGQLVIVDKLTPHFSDYKRGDIVVFSPPAAIAHGSSEPYIKRVIALGGDIVAISAGHVFVNGEELAEPYIFEGQQTFPPNGTSQTWTVPDGDLFVLGDHRENSQDSRSFGPIRKDTVLGRAWIRYWPLDEFGPIGPSPSAGPSGTSNASPTARPSATSTASK